MRAVSLMLAFVAAAALGCDDGTVSRSYDVPRTQVLIAGTGASVPQALFARWAERYAKVDPATTLTYDAAGSGAGMRAALDGTSDFGVSDTPLTDSDAAAHRDVLHVPLAVEAIALVYFIDGPPLPRVQVTEDVAADLFLGKLRYWDDPALASLNPGVKLPHLLVHPVYRSDQSGASYLLSEWLSKTTQRWSWPVSRSLTIPSGIPAEKDDGMVARVLGTTGTIGYVSAVAAAARRMPTLAVRNPAGRFVLPTLEGMRAAASAADLGPDLRAHAVATSGELAYPLCSFTFGLVRVDGGDVARRKALARFLWWATHDGQAFAPPLGFGALPGTLQMRDEEVLGTLRAAGAPAL